MITYNHEKYVREAVESVLAQDTSFEFELVLSNDNSPDGTESIIHSILENHPRASRIKYIRHSENIGMMKNSVHNLAQCSGEYVAFCEGDDAWTDPSKLETQVSEMRKHPECDMSFHPAVVYSGLHPTRSIIATEAFRTTLFSPEAVIRGGGEFCPTASLLIRKRALATLPPIFEEGPVGDYFMQIAGSLRCGALYVNKPMSLYRIHTDCSWNSSLNLLSKKKKFFLEYAKSIQQFDAYLKGRYSEEIHTEIRKHYKDISRLLLSRKNLPEFHSFYHENTHFHQNTFEIRLLYLVGKLTRSPALLNALDRLFFMHPNPLRRVFKKLLLACLRLKAALRSPRKHSEPHSKPYKVWLKN